MRYAWLLVFALATLAGACSNAQYDPATDDSVDGKEDRGSAGALPTYNYSPAMKAAALVWNEHTLDRYLAETVDFLPGTKMYGGLAIKQDRLDLIAWLKQAAQP